MCSTKVLKLQPARAIARSTHGRTQASVCRVPRIKSKASEHTKASPPTSLATLCCTKQRYALEAATHQDLGVQARVLAIQVRRLVWQILEHITCHAFKRVRNVRVVTRHRILWLRKRLPASIATLACTSRDRRAIDMPLRPNLGQVPVRLRLITP